MSVLTGTSADWPHRCLVSAEGLHGFPFDNYIVFNTRKLLLRHLKFKTLRQKSHWWLFKSWFSIWYFPRVRVLGTFTSSAAIWASSCPYIHFTNIHPRFQLHFFWQKNTVTWTRNAQASAKDLPMRGHWKWVNWPRTPAHWCVTSVLRPHWALVLHHVIFHPFPSTFLDTKIHESLASGVKVGWIKVLWLFFFKLMGEIFDSVLEKCSLQSVQMCFIFFLPYSLYVSQWGRGKWRNVFSADSVLCAAPGFTDST